MTTTTAPAANELAIERLQNARGFITKLIETLEPDQYLIRAGGAGTHVAWIIGHLTLADDRFVSEFTGQPSQIPEGYRDLFDGGTQPAATCDPYPSREEMLEHFAASRSRTIDWAGTLEGDLLWQPAPESLGQITPNALSALHTLAEHDFLHAGQIATVRSSLGMKPVFF
jgi:uncharacterized damage-inducible protein DinB